MSSWQIKLQPFIDEQITEELKNYNENNKTNKLTKGEEEIIKVYMNELVTVEDSSNIEPILKYLGKNITPRKHLQYFLDQLKNDIYPLLKTSLITSRETSYTVLRNAFNYLDYIALLRYGPSDPGRKYGKGTGNLDELLNNFGPEDIRERYKRYKKYLIQTYRHDLIHLMLPRPKIIKVKNGKKEEIEIVSPITMSETFNDKNKNKIEKILQDFDRGCLLMKSAEFRKNTFFHLRFRDNAPTVNSISIFFDLVNYIKEYQSSLAIEEKLNREFSEHFIAASLNSSLKLFNKQSLDMSKNSHLFFNSDNKFKKA